MSRGAVVVSRRRALRGAAIGLVTAGVASSFPMKSLAQSSLAAVVRSAYEAEPVRSPRVVLTMPAIAENGNSVAVRVDVDSPMTQTDHVRFVHVHAAGNPVPELVQFTLGPLSGQARVESRVRIAREQEVVAVVGLSDGQLLYSGAQILVAVAACLEGLI